MFTPNKLDYAKCPHCNVTLNLLDWIPLSALASQYHKKAECPCCFKSIEVRVHVTFKVEAFKAE